MTLSSTSAALVSVLLASALSAQTPFTVQSYGPTCGPVAHGVVAPRGNNNFQFNLTLSEAAAQMHVVLIVGLEETAVPIDLGMPCFLLTELLYTELHTTNSGGTYVWHQLLPTNFAGYVRFQFAEADFCIATSQLTVRTSNGVHLAST